MPLVGSNTALANAMKAAIAGLPANTMATTLRNAFLANDDSAAQDNEALTALCQLVTSHILATVLPQVCDALAPVIITHLTVNTIVSPVGLPAPMSNAGGPVVGTGMLL